MIKNGQEIEELERQERTVTWFASRPGCNRQSVCRVSKNNNIIIDPINVSL